MSMILKRLLLIVLLLPILLLLPVAYLMFTMQYSIYFIILLAFPLYFVFLGLVLAMTFIYSKKIL